MGICVYVWTTWSIMSQTAAAFSFKQDPVSVLTSCVIDMKSSDAKASKCHLKFSSKMTIFIKLAYLSSVISLK